eukprot:scaffold18623_cov144-Isochrysis_galbana.AAC.1
MSASLSTSLRADYRGAWTRCVAIFGPADQHSAGAEGAPYRLSAGRRGARPPRSQVSRRILKYDKGTHDQTQAHRGIINQGNPAVGRESGGGPGDGGVGHLLAGPYSGELWGTPTGLLCLVD